jgi:hypothetical protein
MPTVNVGSILTVDKGRYVDDQVNDLVVVTSVTPTTVAGHNYAWIVTLQSAFTSNYRNGFVLTRDRSNKPPLYFIKSVDAAKTTLTVVGDWTPTPPTTNFSGNYSDPPINGNATVTTVNIIKYYQWYRDGVAISRNAAAAVYTTQPADAGKVITVKEEAAYWDTLSTKTIAESASWNVVASATDSALVYSENIVYLGSFALSDSQDGPLTAPELENTKGVSVNYYNGQPTLYVTYLNKTAEYAIPALVNLVANPSYTYSNLNVAPFARNQATSPNRKFFDPTEGKQVQYGVQGNAGFATLYGSLPISDNRLLICSVNNYSYAANSAMWTRPQDITITGQVSNPFFVTDLSAGIPRWYNQYTCSIPSTPAGGNNYQALLGGDVISGSYTLSVDGRASRGPTAIVWNTSDIATTLSAKSVSATLESVQVGGASDQYLLGLGASFGFNPTNDYLTITNGPGRLQTVQVVGWNNTTKVAIVQKADGGATIFPSVNITGITLASPVVITVPNATLLYDSVDTIPGAGITIKGVGGTTQLNNNTYYYIKNTPEDKIPRLSLYQDVACTVPVDGTSFTPWTSGGTADVIPTTASTYQIVPRVSGTTLLAHTQYMQDYGFPLLSGVFSNATGAKGHVIPNGTKSLIYVGTGGDGEWVYSSGAFAFTGQGPLIYDTGMNYSGPHTNPWTTRVWCYNLDELVTVKNGTRPGAGSANWDGAFSAANQLKPYAVFNLTMPFAGNSQTLIAGVAYDSTTKRLYVCGVLGGSFGRNMIHVYEVTNAVAVP